MKKIYLLSLVLLMSVAAFAADATRVKVVFTHNEVSTAEFNHGGNWWNKSVKQGETVNVTGTYDLSSDGNDVVKVTIGLYENTSWVQTASHSVLLHDGTSGKELTGSFNHDIQIPNDLTILPAGTLQKDRHVIQVRVYYGNDTGSGAVDTYVNAYPTFVEGDAPEPVDGSVSLSFNGGVAAEHGITDFNVPAIAPGGTLTVTGTHSELHQGVAASSIIPVIKKFHIAGSVWTDLGVVHTYDAIAINGTAINANLTIPADMPLTASLNDGELYLLQFKVYYGSGVRAANAKLIIEDTANSIAELSSKVKVYPNPVQSGRMVNIAGLSGEVKIDLVNIAGSVVKSVVTSDARATVVADVAPGLYTVCISDGSDKIVKKLLVK